MNHGKRLKDIIFSDPLDFQIMFRVHATQRMFQRRISEEEVFEILRSGAIIEDYMDDVPFPSVLINGQTGALRRIHCVVSLDIVHRHLYIITVYDPDPKKWVDDFGKRRQK